MCPGESLAVKDLFVEREKLLERIKELEEKVKTGSTTSTTPQGPQPVQPSPIPASVKDSTSADSPVANSGTLVVANGQSRYLGGSAMPLWLSQEDALDTRPPSPSTSPAHASSSSLFGPASALTYAQAFAQLPPREEGWLLAESNYRHLAWGGSALSREDFAELYESLQNTEDTHLSFQKLAAVFIVLALGTLVSLELPLDDPTGRHYFDMARQCLVNGRFLTHTTLIGVETVSMMARYCCYAAMRRGWDLAWQLRGLAMRLIISMGLHRDGRTWKLSPHDLNDRRQVFWDAYSQDIFLSRCWDRPPTGIAADQYDTQFPDTCSPYELYRYKLAVLVKQALDESLRITPSPYSRIVEIWQALVKAEADVPFELRCRATTRAMVSRYTTTAAADEATPEPSRRDVRLAFQQHALTLDYCAGVFLLLRPYFVHALYSHPEDPTQSPYGDAYLAVIERSSMMIAMLRSIHGLYPLLSTRHWQFWSHAFSGAVCMATVCILSPGSALVTLAMTELESVIALLHSILASLPRPELRKNLAWLLQLRERAQAKISAAAAPAPSPQPAEDAFEHLSLVGWRTRLIQLGEGRPREPVPSMPAASLPEPADWYDNTLLTSRLPDATGLSPDFQLLGAPVGQPFPIEDWSADHDNKDAALEMLGLWQ
ncbi:hypothetical protein A1Q1_05775 [Trichosporon asahii var. asahii CBS 2479]|uniref:Xylanolytic transcriptional activator regulatory domain-containing protein n=1 Tax=Trichosporon asahii var. asahii (strain ATCC 90039 / CBS 2479 / JCM 2466 / KCTC 7840 / NBRC 103889/ NCYC 2677 / UAMH 7654) TaxID=1186058 RepID=J5SH94_TRIAS|nr:hypothetical protein A1Q1_05775 [Trichosporon asahii var. asahii CBS 2479]EJT45626.1 hypothetical protein A1Q1_05775 [Trichosporon asahii var. asahii CBS 2479]